MPSESPHAPPLWTNQLLTVYHGTTKSQADLIVRNSLDVTYGGHNKDFGQGFYTTTLKQQARRRAIELEQSRRRGDKPYLVTLHLDRRKLANLSALAFVTGQPDAEDFWSFVRHCRRRQPFHYRTDDLFRRYDLVYGPLVLFWQARTCFPHSDQISFHTMKAQSLLNDPQSGMTIEPV